MTEEQIKMITEKMESLFQKRWVEPVRKIIVTMSSIDKILKKNKCRFNNHDIRPESKGYITAADPFGRMDLSFRFGDKWTNIIIQRRSDALHHTASISMASDFDDFTDVFFGCKYDDIGAFVSHTWAGNTDRLLELKKFLEEETEKYFGVIASVVEKASECVAGWLNTCNASENRASNILLEEFGIETEVKKAKVLKITVEEVEA